MSGYPWTISPLTFREGSGLCEKHCLGVGGVVDGGKWMVASIQIILICLEKVVCF